MLSVQFQCHTSSTVFRHLLPNSARFSYATDETIVVLQTIYIQRKRERKRERERGRERERERETDRQRQTDRDRDRDKDRQREREREGNRLEIFSNSNLQDEAPTPLPLFISLLLFHLSPVLLGARRFGLFRCGYSSFHNRLDLIREPAFYWVFYFIFPIYPCLFHHVK